MRSVHSMSEAITVPPLKKRRHPCIISKHTVVKVRTSKRIAMLCQTCNEWIGRKYEQI